MAWPYDVVLPTLTEFFINGAWTSAYSTRLRAEGRVTITRGQTDQQSSLAPQTSDFTLNSRDGLFSNRNPLSPLYKLFGRNTRVRHSVLTAAGTWDAYFLKLWQSGGTWFTTADKAVLDITGDIDVRFEITPSTWKPSLPQVIGGKYVTGGQRSWLVTLMPDGMIRWNWTPDGTTINQATSTLGFGAATGRYALRVTLDVDNGAAGRTTTFYWATSLAGPWTLLSSSTAATTTSIFNSTANLEIGGANANGSSPFSGEIGLIGKVHGAEVYQNIAGTLRAKFDPTGRTPGDTTWSDGLGTPNTWTLTGTNGRITSDRIRFTGEISSIPQEWDLTGRDVYLPIRASGALRRLIQGGQPLHSAIYRNFIQYTDINGYWPLEAASGATKADSAVSGTTSSITDVSFSGTTPDGLEGSGGAATFTSTNSRMYFYSPGRASTGEASFVCYFRLDALPAAVERNFIRVSGNGSMATMEMTVGPATYSFYLSDYTGAVLSSEVGIGFGVSPLDQWIGFSFVQRQVGGNVNYEIVWHAVGTDTFYTPTIGGKTYAGTVGRFGTVLIDGRNEATFQGTQIAHVLMTRGDTQADGGTSRDVSKGYSGEAAGARLLRLAGEEGLSVDMYGDPADTELMGAQRPAKLLDLYQECATVDGGVLAEPRDAIGLQYVTRRWLGEQSAVTLNYANSDLATTPKPIDDDRYLMNDVTASRPLGSSARSVIESGAMSINDPPDGVGRYETTVTKNAASDEQLQGLAEWETFWRTWDEARVPNVVVGLHRTPFNADTFRTNAVLEIGVGSPITVSNLPDFMPPDDMRLLSFGYTEVIEQKTWTLTFNTAPYGPYRSYRLDSGASSDDEARLAGSIENPTTLNAAVNSTATSIVINTPTGYPKWTTDAATDNFYANLGGEKILVTACTVGSTVGGNWQQTLTVTRSVNGIVKSHLINAEIDIWDLAYLQLGA